MSQWVGHIMLGQLIFAEDEHEWVVQTVASCGL